MKKIVQNIPASTELIGLNNHDNGPSQRFESVVWAQKKEPRHEISNNVVCAISKASDQPAHTRSLIRAYASRLNIL